jgi:hypothetical protein
VTLVDESRPGTAALANEGRRIGAGLDTRNAIVVVGRVPDDAAAVALGIGEVQSTKRRVVVADLAGDTPALARLTTSDDPHGLSDSFRYGVSLNRVAQPVGEGGNLFVLPSGTEPVADEEIYRNDRWRRLVAGFREVGALLVLVAPRNAAALEVLIGYTDGVVPVGHIEVPGLVIAHAEDAARVASRPRPDRAPSGTRPAPPAPPRRFGGRVLAGAGVVAAAVLVLVALGIRGRAHGETSLAMADSANADSAAVAAATSARSVESASAAVAPDIPPIRNPADSAIATAYAIEIAKFSTPTGALMRVRDELPKTAPAATFGVVAIGADATLWYRVISGAATARSGADSTLATLRATKAIDDPAAGAIVSVPFAYRLQSAVAPASLPAMIDGYLARGVPAYALLQDDGTATVYAGAFESAEQAALFTTYLRAAGVEPALTYRLGRALQ